MPDEGDQLKASIDAVMQSLGNLRYSVSEFQDSIEDYLVSVEETWREVKSHLASVEARLASMEVRLSSLAVDGEVQLEELNAMRNDIAAIGKELMKMRQRFRSFAEGTLERIN